MKKLISVIVALALVLSLSATVFATGGAGFQDDPYVIDSLEGGFEMTAGTGYMDYDVYYKYVAEKNGTIVTDADCNVWFALDDAFSFTWATAGDSSIEVEAGDVLYINICNPSVMSDYTAMLYYEGDEVTNGGAGGDDTDDSTVPSGSALTLGDNAVSLTYATMPAMAPYWTYTATADGSLTVTVTEINGNTMLDMAFGRMMYTLLVGETDGQLTNTATVAMTAGETVNIAVLDTMDFDAVPATLNLTFSTGNGGTTEIREPADYFEVDGDGNFVISSLAEDVEIFSGTGDYYFAYTAEEAGVVTVTPTVEGYAATNVCISVNGGDWDWSASPATVSAGDVVLINIWGGYEGYVTLTAGEGGEGGGDIGGGNTDEKDPADYFEKDDEGYYVIDTLPVDIFVGNDDISYIYVAEEDGVVTVTPSVDGYTATNCWIYVNGVCDTSASPATVTAGDVVLINIWSGYEGTVTIGDGSDVPGGDVGGDEPADTLPSGSALALGNNVVSLTYATMPMMAPYWTYTATEAGYLTVTVNEINGNNMLGMAFGMGMYTLLVGETDGMGSNTATVYMAAGETVNIAVLDSMDFEAVPATLNVAFVGGEPVVEKDPADYFETNDDGHYVIDSIPANIFVGNDDIYFVYVAEADGVLNLTATVDGYAGTNCAIMVNDGDWDWSATSATVAAGDTVLINIWGGYEGTVTIGDGSEGGDEGGDNSATDATISADGLDIPFTPDADGILTVVISGNPGYEVVVFETETDATIGLPKKGSTEQTLTFELIAGTAYTIRISGYDAAAWDYAEATISYDITFEAAELEVEIADLDKTETILDLGENTIDMMENTIVSLFEFTPAEPGVYTFTVENGDIAIYGFSAWNLITEGENGVVEYTVTAAEQTLLVGITADAASVTLKVEKTGDYTPEEAIEYETYEPTDDLVEDFEEPADLENIDITVEQNVILGDDGYYHLGTANGPIIYVNLNNDQFTLALLYDAGAPITMRGIYVDEDGVAHYYDFMSMITSLYYSYSLENDYHPLNTDLMIFLKAYGTSQGWYNPNTSGFETITDGEFEEESAWLASCYISTAEEDVEDEPETDEPETEKPETDKPETDEPETDKPEVDAPETDEPETDKPETDKDETTDEDDDVPETGSVGILGAVASMIISAMGGVAVVLKKKED